MQLDITQLDITTWVAIAALIISIVNGWRDWYKGRQAKKKSIQDDFWIRKVLFDMALSPALEAMSRRAENLAEAHEIKGMNELLIDFNQECRAIGIRLRIAGVLGPELYTNLTSAFEIFEGAVTEYYGKFQDGCSDTAEGARDRADTMTKIEEAIMRMLKSTKSHQEKV